MEDSFIDCNLEEFFIKKNKYSSIYLAKNKIILSNNILAKFKIVKKSLCFF